MPYKDHKVRLLYYRHWHRAEAARRRATHRMILSILRAAPCDGCGQFSARLDWHHARGKKRFNIASQKGRHWRILFAEIAKCDLLCRRCHQDRHRKGAQ